jgi:beta-1,2-mannobiose phosphorylase / 1,2-beta-oligomannan phosphorylase
LVPYVVFPTGLVPDGENLLVYYGAADAVAAVAEFSLGEVLAAMSAWD